VQGFELQVVDAWNNASAGNTLLRYGNNGEIGNSGQDVDDRPQ
jgi:hypothetical protein